jgi:O-antigen ligase
MFLLDNFAKTLVVFFLLANVLHTTARLRVIGWTLALGSAPLAATAVRNLAAGVWAETPIDGVTRIRGYDAPLTLNPNDLALALNLALPLTFALFQTCHRALQRTLLGGLVVLQVVGVICTYSRGGFLLLLFLGALCLWRLTEPGPRRATVIALLACGLLASVPFWPSGYVERIGTITDASSDSTGSSMERWRDLGAALSMVARAPLFGAGAGMHVLSMNELRGETWREVHNVYLEIAADLGLPGLALFLVLLVSSLRSARRAAAAAGDPQLRRIAQAVWITLAGFALAGLLYPVAYEFFFYYYAALAVAAAHTATVAARGTP